MWIQLSRLRDQREKRIDRLWHTIIQEEQEEFQQEYDEQLDLYEHGLRDDVIPLRDTRFSAAIIEIPSFVYGVKFSLDRTRTNRSRLYVSRWTEELVLVIHHDGFPVRGEGPLDVYPIEWLERVILTFHPSRCPRCLSAPFAPTNTPPPPTWPATNASNTPMSPENQGCHVCFATKFVTATKNFNSTPENAKGASLVLRPSLLLSPL